MLALSCSRDFNNPFETDEDLNHSPKIETIVYQSGQGFVMQLDRAYSTNAVLLFERKSGTAFDPIVCQRLTASTFADTLINPELNYNLAYRVKVQKGQSVTTYSEVKPIIYTSSIVNAATNFTATSIVMQGVRLNWWDNSGVETGYEIEKNVNGAGYTEIASLPANATTYLHSITGMPESTINLSYR